MSLFFLHGLESSPQGFRARYLRERFPHIKVPSLPKDIWRRRAILEDLIQEPALFVGSSLGGLSALDFAVRNPQLTLGLVLLAPAVGFHNPEYRTPEVLDFVARLHVPREIPARVIAGNEDEVIPLQAIQGMVARSPQPERIELLVFNDGHRLHLPQALDAMIEGVQLFGGDTPS